MNLFILATSLLILATLEARLPTFLHLRIELLPALVAYGGLTLQPGAALVLALAAGFTQDALSASPFGLTALVYGIAATMLSSVREAFDRELPWVQMGAGALTSAGVSFAACCVVGFGFGALIKFLLLAVLSAVITPLLFFVLDYARYRTRTS